MQAYALLLLRISIGILMIIWSLDKLLNPEHSQFVMETHYINVVVSMTLFMVFGLVQIIFGTLVVFGYLRSVAYPLLILGTAVTLVAVFRSVIDPWGWYFQESNVLFYPSLIIFAGAIVLYAFRSQDTLSLDNTRLHVL